MLFRRLNWNIVSWFPTVSRISYAVMAIGLAFMIYHGFQGGQGFQPARLGLGGGQVPLRDKSGRLSDQVRRRRAHRRIHDHGGHTAIRGRRLGRRLRASPVDDLGQEEGEQQGSEQDR